MELRHYARILWRSWPLVVGLPVLVALLTAALWLLLPAKYAITAAVLVTQRPIGVSEPQITLPDENNFHSWQASEFIVDDILQIVETRRFADDISAWLQAEHGVSIEPAQISAGLEAERQHRMIFLHVVGNHAEHVRLIAQGAIAMLRDNGLAYWDREESTGLEVSQMELPAAAVRAQGPVGLAVDMVLRSILALLLAIGIAFLRNYLDQSLSRRDQVEALGFDVVGTVPLERREPRRS